MTMTKAQIELRRALSLANDADVAYDRDPASSFRLRARAEAAMREWREKYPALAAERDAEIKAERERRAAERKADYESSFVARLLD